MTYTGSMRFMSRSKYLLQCLIILGLSMTTSAIYAQKKVRIQHADEGKGGKRDGERFDKLVGNVVFKQNQTTIYCDSALIFKKKNLLEAYGRVHITEGDSIDITGSRLDYDGNTKLARLRRNVVFRKKATATLYTDNLDFSRPRNIAYYYNGGTLVDSTNTLKSVKGYYNLTNNMASFKKNVHVKNPDYTMTADSLQYNSKTKVIFFVSETTVVNKDSSTFVYQNGIYNTATKKSDVRSGTGESEDYTISGLDYDYDGIREIGKVRGNVVMTSKKENLIIYGQASDYFKLKGITKVYNKAYVAKVTEDNDTLFMSADTLVSIDSDDPKKDRLLAYKNVKIYKRDMQGKADSLEYRMADSTLFFYKQPALWSEGNQMTADSIRMLIKNNTLNKVFLVSNAFVISQDTLNNYNQIKGRRMTTELAGGKINRVIVMGNGESIYHLIDEKTMVLMGMNYMICSNIIIRFKEGRVNNLTSYVKPDARFIPPHELKADDQSLKGFKWKGAEKPTRTDVVKVQSPGSAKPIQIKKAVQ
jgi:lipopolysaccharide export system protein LptA